MGRNQLHNTNLKHYLILLFFNLILKQTAFIFFYLQGLVSVNLHLCSRVWRRSDISYTCTFRTGLSAYLLFLLEFQTEFSCLPQVRNVVSGPKITQTNWWSTDGICFAFEPNVVPNLHRLQKTFYIFIQSENCCVGGYFIKVFTALSEVKLIFQFLFCFSQHFVDNPILTVPWFRSRKVLYFPSWVWQNYLA